MRNLRFLKEQAELLAGRFQSIVRHITSVHESFQAFFAYPHGFVPQGLLDIIQEGRDYGLSFKQEGMGLEKPHKKNNAPGRCGVYNGLLLDETLCCDIGWPQLTFPLVDRV